MKMFILKGNAIRWNALSNRIKCSFNSLLATLFFLNHTLHQCNFRSEKCEIKITADYCLKLKRKLRNKATNNLTLIWREHFKSLNWLYDKFQNMAPCSIQAYVNIHPASRTFSYGSYALYREKALHESCQVHVGHAHDVAKIRFGTQAELVFILKTARKWSVNKA